MTQDELEPDPRDKQAVDSFLTGLKTAARSHKGQSLISRAIPWILASLTGIAGVVGGKLSTKEEMAKALEVRQELEALKKQQAELLQRLDQQLFATEPPRGRIVKLERGQYFVWRALSEVRAAVYTDQPERRARRMDEIGARYAVAFDRRAQEDPGHIAYDKLFPTVRVDEVPP